MTDWNASQFLPTSDPSQAEPYAILVLNSPMNVSLVEPLLHHATFIICADGGANRFYKAMKSIGKDTEILPDLILGDLDSLSQETRQHYTSQNVTIEHNPDQYSTDFTKCLRWLSAHASEISAGRLGRKQSNHIAPTSSTSEESRELATLVIGGLDGRVDQGVAQLHQLYMITPPGATASSSTAQIASKGNLKPYLLTTQNITFLLSTGLNTIYLPSYSPSLIQSHKSPAIGIMPLSGPARITTTGLNWDVQEWETRIGGQVSTSNRLRDEGPDVDESGRSVVTVKTDERVLFTVEIVDAETDA